MHVRKYHLTSYLHSLYLYLSPYLSLSIYRLFSPTGSSIAHLSICFFLSLYLSLYITLLPSPPPHSPPFNYYPPFSSLLKNKTSLSLFHPPPSLLYIRNYYQIYNKAIDIEIIYIMAHMYVQQRQQSRVFVLPSPPLPGGGHGNTY